MESTPARGALRHFLAVPYPRKKDIRFRLVDLGRDDALMVYGEVR